MMTSSDDIIPMTTKGAYLAVREELRDKQLMDTVCSICKGHACTQCINCKGNSDPNAAPCLLTRGECGHIFHVHCLDAWLKGNEACPHCGVIWRASGPDFSP